MALASDKVIAEVIDWEDFKKAGRRYGVAAVLKTFFDYEESFVGALPEGKILQRLIESTR